MTNTSPLEVSFFMATHITTTEQKWSKNVRNMYVIQLREANRLDNERTCVRYPGSDLRVSSTFLTSYMLILLYIRYIRSYTLMP